jgi:exosortase
MVRTPRNLLLDYPTSTATVSGEGRNETSQNQVQRWSIFGFLTLLLLAAYWNTIEPLFDVWRDPQYSHGWLIPVISVAIMWILREPLEKSPTSDRWIGVGLIVLGTLMRVEGSRRVIFTADRLSLIPCLLGVFVLVGGLRTLRWAGPAIVFLALMYPWPRFMTDGISRPLKLIATKCSVFGLQSLGVETFREGNRIQLENMPMQVVDQCSGLRMLTVFTAMALAMAILMTKRPWWERLIVVVSAVPIALVVNVVRITATGWLYSMGLAEDYHELIHDVWGWLMMPLALGLLFLETYTLSHLVVDERSDATASTPLGLIRMREDNEMRRL